MGLFTKIKIKKLIKTVERGDVQSVYAARALGDIGDPRAVEPLIQLLKNGNNNVRMYTAQALGYIGDSGAVEPLIQLLKDRDNNVRWYVAGALRDIGDPRAVEPLVQVALKDKFDFPRLTAIEALGRIGDPRSVEALIQILEDEEFHFNAAEALKEIGKPAVEPLKQAVRYKSGNARMYAKWVLEEIEEPSAVDPLSALKNLFQDVEK